MEQSAHQVPIFVTIIFTVLLVAVILCLALEEKIHAQKSLIVGIAAVFSLFLGQYFHLLPIGFLINVFSEKLNIPVFIQGIDWSVITIMLGSGVFVDVISKSGLFTWIAIKLTKKSKGDPLVLLVYYGLMTVVFSAVLNNVTAMIIVGSLSTVSLTKLEKLDKLLGFLIIEGLLTNVGGLLTLISSVPNIIVGQSAGISFIKFFLVAGPYVLIATIVTIFMGARIFNINKLSNEEEINEAVLKVSGFDENDGIESWGFFKFGIVMTILFILVIATTSVLPVIKDLGMGYVAMGFAAIALIRYKSETDKFYKSIDWDLIGFFIALFVLINVMEHAQVLNMIGNFLTKVIDLGPKAGVASVLFGSAIFSSVTDNIPLAAMLAKILVGLKTASDSNLWWAVIFGANLGGNITPIGSASTLVAVTIIHKNKLNLSFMGFVKASAIFATVQLILACIYVLVFI